MTYNGGGFSADEEKSLSSASGDVLNEKIAAVGDHIRKIKGEKASKDQIKSEVNVLLKLKEFYKNQTGNAWTPNVVPMPMPKKDPVKVSVKMLDNFTDFFFQKINKKIIISWIFYEKTSSIFFQPDAAPKVEHYSGGGLSPEDLKDLENAAADAIGKLKYLENV